MPLKATPAEGVKKLTPFFFYALFPIKVGNITIPKRLMAGEVRGYRGLRLLKTGEPPEPLAKAIVPPVTGNLLNDSPSVILTPEANNAVWFGNVPEPKRLEFFQLNKNCPWGTPRMTL